MAAFLLSVHPSINPTPLEFEFWRGEAPQLIHERVQQFTKPGTNGHGERLLGQWGVPVSVQLESHFSSYTLAIAALQTYFRVPGSGVIQVVYNSLPWSAFKLGFTVQSVTLDNESHARILQMGPSYSYANAGILLTRWQMTAVNTGA